MCYSFVLFVFVCVSTLLTVFFLSLLFFFLSHHCLFYLYVLLCYCVTSWLLSSYLLLLSLFHSFICLFSLHYTKFVQRRALFDSVSLVIQGSVEGELSLMDNLSGSICHYYALPPRPRKHSTDKKVNNQQNDDSLTPLYSSSGSFFLGIMYHVGLHKWSEES